jgi:hypothetical protein
MPSLRTTVIHVASHQMDEANDSTIESHQPRWCHSSMQRGVSRTSFLSSFFVVLRCFLLSSTMLPCVSGARARQLPAHLLHVAVSPLRLRSLRPAQPEQVDQLTLVRLFFDRPVGVHAPSGDGGELVALTCDGTVVPLTAWSGAPPTGVELVVPVEPWMDFFEDEALDDDDDDGEQGGLVLPQGSVGAGGSPFASNSFGLILASPEDADQTQLQSCTLTLRMDLIAPSKGKNSTQKSPAAAASRLEVPLAPMPVDPSQAKKPPRQRKHATTWSAEIHTTRWIMPARMARSSRRRSGTTRSWPRRARVCGMNSDSSSSRTA